MKTKEPLTQAFLKSVLHYDCDTGLFVWRENRGRIKALSHAGGDSRGYTRIRVNYGWYRAHRLAWLYMTGNFPDCAIDHINGTRDDNRWSNLRLATGSVNQQNRHSAASNSKSGFLGVIPIGEKFFAQIYVNRGDKRYLGTYATPELAHAAYVKAKRELHPANDL